MDKERISARAPAIVRTLKRKREAKPSAEYVTVTPELATGWLENTGRNRNLNRRTVEQYAAAMRRGDWMTTGQGITFDENGKLIDGQHRLHAVVEADKSVEMLVTRAVSGRSQLVTDMGRKRTPHDQIALREGWDVTPMHIAVAKAMWTGFGGPGIKELERAKTDIQLMDRYYIRHRKAIEWAVALFNPRATIRGVTIAPVIAPIARAYYSEDVNDLTRFAEVVATGMAEHRNDGPAVVLRNWLLAGREKALSARAGKDRYSIYRRTELALRAFLDKKNIERLGQMRLEEELFPIPGDKRDK